MNTPRTPLTQFGFEQTADLIGRLRDPIRQRLGACETVVGHLDDAASDATERVVLAVDLCTGSAAIIGWGPA